jgi:hypothetical protein
LGASGPGNLLRVVELGGSVHRSLHRRGPLLVLVAALLGAVIGGAMGLVVEDARTGTEGAVPGPRRGTALATSPPASQPAGSQADGSDASGVRRAERAHRPDKRNDKADKRLKDQRDKPKDRGNGKSGKTKNTSSQGRLQRVASSGHRLVED